jgi:hypothetical protein
LRPVTLPLAARDVELHPVRNSRARRYILRVRRDGLPLLVIPRGGTLEHGLEFARRHSAWLEKQLAKPRSDRRLRVGSTLWLRGELVPIMSGTDSRQVQAGPIAFRVRDVSADDLRPEIERQLRRVAASELMERTRELAAEAGRSVARVTVRSQRTRWGSCSRRGNLSLNWRLIQCPDFVRDYIILHELAHLKEMNHSRRFWAEVERLCPDFRRAEQWLRKHASLLA